MSKPKARLLLCGPRGFCAGVDRAIQIVVLALKKYGAPVYVRHEIVHNRYVVEGLENLGAIFIKDLDEIPETDQPMIFSAHGVPKSVSATAAERNMLYLDATCPLVSKVHKQAISHDRKCRHVLLVGHRDHPEVIGTMGQLPEGAVTLIETLEDVDQFAPAANMGLGYVTQTTLSVDDTSDIIARMQERFPEIHAPAAESICYATTNRQESVKAVASDCDLFLVVGAPISSNSNRLVDVASRAGAKIAKLVQNAGEIDCADIERLGEGATIGLSAGASAPELLVEGIVKAFRERFDLSVELAETTVEDEQFMVMRELRDVPLAAADMSFVNGSA